MPFERAVRTAKIGTEPKKRLRQKTGAERWRNAKIGRRDRFPPLSPYADVGGYRKGLTQFSLKVGFSMLYKGGAFCSAQMGSAFVCTGSYQPPFFNPRRPSISYQSTLEDVPLAIILKAIFSIVWSIFKFKIVQLTQQRQIETRQEARIFLVLHRIDRHFLLNRLSFSNNPPAEL